MAAFIWRQLTFVPPLPVYGTMSDFTLTNQNGLTVTLADLRGQVWIADAIFTRCPGQCLIMSAHMKEIQNGLPSGLPIRLVSFTTDADFDQPPVLKKYAERFGANDELLVIPDRQQKRVAPRGSRWTQTLRARQARRAAGRRQRPVYP